MSSAFEKRRLKYAASVNDNSLSESTDPDFELKYVDIGNVDSQGSINEIASYSFKKAPSRARRQVKHGDVIISTVRTYLQAIAPIKNPESNLIVSTGFAVARPNSLVLSDDYFKYAARESSFLSEVEARSKGVSYPAINSSELVDILIPLPPIDIQKQIADYLDRETTKIDALIAEKERSIALIEEKREALISHAVTTGLNPNALFKFSGLEWLGDIPQHWNIDRGKNLFSVRDRRSETGDEELLSVSHITGVTSRAEKQVYMFKAEDMTGYKQCEKGDFITNTLWAWMGAMGISPLDGIVSPDYHVYIFKDELLPEFMELLCRSKPFIAEVMRWSKGVWSSRLRLYPENFFEIQFPIPPKSEQLEIIDKIEKEDAKTKELKNALTDSIALIKERRSALITAAVTGQIELEDMMI